MGNHHESRIDVEAHQTARHLFEDINSGKQNGLERIIDEITAERRTRTPADFQDYMKVLNLDVKKVVPDLTIVDADNTNNTKTLSIHERWGPRHLGKNDGREIDLDIQFHDMQVKGAVKTNRGDHMTPS